MGELLSSPFFALGVVMSKVRLNLGCGSDIKDGWINLDAANITGVDVIHDLESFPYPFEDNSIDEVVCQDVLEHVDYPAVLEELFRIMKHGAVLKIRVPHFTSFRNFVDPTHKRLFSIKTFDFFITNPPHGRNYYYSFHFSHIASKRITFNTNRLFAVNKIISLLVNGSKGIMNNYYEQTFLSRIFPAENIEITIIK